MEQIYFDLFPNLILFQMVPQKNFKTLKKISHLLITPNFHFRIIFYYKIIDFKSEKNNLKNSWKFCMAHKKNTNQVVKTQISTQHYV